jgi:hypothetical protein
MSPKTTADPREAEVLAQVEYVETGLLDVIDQRTQNSPTPRHRRRLARHAVIDLAGRLMMSEIDCDGEDARRRCLLQLRELVVLVHAHGRSKH